MTNINKTPNIGLTTEQIQKLTAILRKTLADEVLLNMLLRKYHWNVTGATFSQLHELFEKQYEETAEIIDEIAEYIRIYGEVAPGTLKEFLDDARIKENPGKNGSADEMLLDTLAAHEAIIQNLRKDAETAGSEIGDPAIEDFLVGILHQQQKMAWMIRVSLSKI